MLRDTQSLRATGLRGATMVLVAFVGILLISPVAALGQAATSDDFNRHNLADSLTPLWTYVPSQTQDPIPLDDSWVAMTGAPGDAKIELSVPAGTSHNPWMDNNNSVRVMQPCADTDFTVQVKLDTEPSAQYQIQGILVEEDADDWLRFDIFHDGTNLYAFAAKTVGGLSAQVALSGAITTGNAQYLRITRSFTSNEWTYEYSADGLSWTTAGATFVHALTVSSIGIMAGNHSVGGLSAPAFTAIFDSFEVSGSALTFVDDTTPPTDTIAPFIHTPSTTASPPDGLTVRWYTDEPCTGTVEFGTTTSYELGSPSDGGGLYYHEVTISPLTPEQIYHYRIGSDDGLGNIAWTGDYEILFSTDGPTIDVWYGLTQTFGSEGYPQRWINILGNVSDPDGVTGLSYTLNGGAPVTLSMGPDGLRLDRAGDFNIELWHEDLGTTPGINVNTVVITATDGVTYQSTETVTVNYDYDAARIWSLPYATDWSSLTTADTDPGTPDPEIQGEGQAVDGKWSVDTAAGTVRTVENGYDRFIAIGDTLWEDYEATISFTFNTLDPSYGVGLLTHWRGHTDDPIPGIQPKAGYLPSGEIGWIRATGLQLFHGGVSEPFTPSIGTLYWLKMRVENNVDGTLYKLKAWADGDTEPPTYTLTSQLDDATTSNLRAGSVLLLAHEADVSFGDLSVAPLTPETAPVVSDIPDQQIVEGNSFATINLDDFVEDVDHLDSEITWTYGGNSALTVNISPARVATITPPSPAWIGSETITFTATDPDLLTGSDPATFTVIEFNNPPVVSDIPDQTIDEGDSFATINLDDFVEDVETPDADIIWTYSDDLDNDLIVDISYQVDHWEATISTPDPDWFGAETITFHAEDQAGLMDEDSALFTVTGVNDPPTADNDPATVVDGGSVIIDVLDGDGDIDGTLDPASVALGLISPAHGTIDFINPATGQITYTHTDIGNLAPDTFTYTVRDNENAISNEATVTITVVAQQPLAFESDDFNSCSLDPRWTFVPTPVPGDPGSATVVGSYTGDAAVEIYVPAGASHQIWNGAIDAPYIIQDADDTDFILEVKWDSPVVEPNYRMQGVVVKNADASEYLRLEFYSNGANTSILAARPDNSLPVTVTIGATGIAPLWMRVVRETVVGPDNDTWTLYYSTDGTNFTGVTPFTYEMTLTGIGLYAGNHGDFPEHTAAVDYFMAKSGLADPIIGEDAGQAGLDITIVGNGSVTPSPDQTSYSCGQAVTLTPVADPGWQFDSWSGGLTGNDNPGTLFMNGPTVVTATFVATGAPNTVAIDGTGVSTLSTANTCAADIPITIERTEFLDLRLYSITFALTDLTLCDGPSSITEGTYLSDAGGTTQFYVTDNEDGSYTVDGSILGTPCGATAASGTLFYVDVTNAIPDGTGSISLVSVVLRSCDNGDFDADMGPPLDIQIDTTPPAPVADLLAQQLLAGNPVGLTTAIDLSWTASAGLDAVSQDVYRKGVGFYPEYDDGGGVLPTLPSDPIAENWEYLGTLDATTETYQIPAGGDRDYWFACVVVKDAAGNASMAMSIGQLNYLLADVSDGGDPFTDGDNIVGTADVARLGFAYGEAIGETFYDPILDVGPTEDPENPGIQGNQYDLPQTDNIINFDDLMIFGISYGMNAGPILKQPFETWSSPLPADRNNLTLLTPALPEIGQTFQVSLLMTGDGRIQGLSIPLLWDEDVVEPVGVQPGELLAAQGGIGLALAPEPGKVDVALMGVRERGIAGEGVLAEVTFRVLATGDPGLDFGEILARGQDNQSVDLMAEVVTDVVDADLAPRVTALHSNVPNPFNPQTTIAFDVARTGHVRVKIYGVDGRLVRTLVDETLTAGRYSEVWNGTDQQGRRVSSGVYLYRMESPDLQQTRRMLLLK